MPALIRLLGATSRTNNAYQDEDMMPEEEEKEVGIRWTQLPLT
ncbi:MAG TPA: hypothetical protein VE244_13480 [Nitrososphaeraceae archaeon]|nr:hypothetical protein [Nitrososphaeraceae archaeon]